MVRAGRRATEPPERLDDADVEVPPADALVLAGRGRLLSAADWRVLTGCAAQIGSAVRERRLARSADEAAEREAADRAGGGFAAAEPLRSIQLWPERTGKIAVGELTR